MESKFLNFWKRQSIYNYFISIYIVQDLIAELLCVATLFPLILLGISLPFLFPISIHSWAYLTLLSLELIYQITRVVNYSFTTHRIVHHNVNDSKHHLIFGLLAHPRTTTFICPAQKHQKKLFNNFIAICFYHNLLPPFSPNNLPSFIMIRAKNNKS